MVATKSTRAASDSLLVSASSYRHDYKDLNIYMLHSDATTKSVRNLGHHSAAQNLDFLIHIMVVMMSVLVQGKL